MNGKWPTALTAETLEQLSDEEFWRYAHELALTAPAEASPAEYLQCKVGRGHCFIPLITLYEVVPPPHQFVLLPSIPTWMPGVVAWHGETIAVVDLDVYLSANMPQSVNDPDQFPSSGHGTATLLVANYSGLPVGLLVPTAGLTMTTGLGDHGEPGAFLLDLPAVLTDLVQQIRDSCPP